MSSVARTYAQALYEAAGDDVDRVADELDAFAAVRSEAPDAWAALVAPDVPAEARKRTIDVFMREATQLVRNTLKLLVDNGRLEDVAEVARALRAMVDERAKLLDVHVTTAIELDDQLRSRLEQRLSASTGSQVRLHTSVDPDIIGGLVVRHGDTLVDTSLRGRLDQLRLELSRPVPHQIQPSGPAQG